MKGEHREIRAQTRKPIGGDGLYTNIDAHRMPGKSECLTASVGTPRNNPTGVFHHCIDRNCLKTPKCLREGFQNLLQVRLWLSQRLKVFRTSGPPSGAMCYNLKRNREVIR